jgi:hypothetical protein
MLSSLDYIPVMTAAPFRAATVMECPWACGPPMVMKTRPCGIVESMVCGALSTERSLSGFPYPVRRRTKD